MVLRSISAALLIALAGFYAGNLRAGGSGAIAAPPLERLPRHLDAWWGEDLPANEAAVTVLAADALLHRCYRRADGSAVWLFVAYYGQQQLNAQIHSPRNCLPGGGWQIASLEREAEAGLPMSHMRIRREEHGQEVYYWFGTQQGRLVGEYALKWDLVKNALARRPTNSAFVRFNAQRRDSTALRELMQLLEPSLSDILAEAGL